MIYKGITSFRNYLFDKGYLKEFSPEVFCIGVGNLTVGGTGKTPMVNYLLENFSERQLGVISRGYGRKSKGFLEINAESTPQIVGDEPFMLAKENPNVHFFVSESRVNGYHKALELYPEINLFVFDDVFQHRYIKPQLRIMLSDYQRLFTRQKMLPFGLLRESKSGAQRADMVVITKCPQDLSDKEKKEIELEVRRFSPNAELYFAEYRSMIPQNALGKELKFQQEVVLISALADNSLFFQQQSAQYKVLEHLAFRDHYAFTKEKVQEILKKHPIAPLICTDKDLVKIKGFLSQEELSRFYVPKIKVIIEHSFQKSIAKRIESYKMK